MAIDPVLGVQPYTMEPDRVTKPGFARRDDCLRCHGMHFNGGVRDLVGDVREPELSRRVARLARQGQRRPLGRGVDHHQRPRRAIAPAGAEEGVVGQAFRRAKDFLDDMAALEKGAIANPDEGRMVGHYWLRAPEIAPTPEIRDEIVKCYTNVREFVLRTHQKGEFMDVLVIGIGGSALGPMFVSDALGDPR